MANKDFNLSNLKKEIHSRKTQKEVSLNENGGTTTKIARDTFLNGLLVSLNTGQASQATQIVKAIDENATIKEHQNNGLPVPQTGSKSASMSSELTAHASPGTNVQHTAPTNTNGQDREHLLFEEMERRKKEMMSGGVAFPQNTGQQSQSTSMSLNEEKIYEIMDKAVTDKIADKFAIIVEHAMKDNLVEIYAKARMKETIEENREFIKKIVYEIIRELQSKNKKPQS